MNHLRWTRVPPHVQNAIVQQIGPVDKDGAQTVPGKPDEFAARMYGADDHVFIKAIPTTSPYAYLHKHERWAARQIAVTAPSAPVPRKLWETEVGANAGPRWYITAWELINDHARPVDLRRGITADLPDALDAVAQLGKLLTPCPPNTPTIVRRLQQDVVPKARLMLKTPRSAIASRDLYERALDGFVIDRLNGETLLHSNLSPRHMLIKDKVASVVGWGRACSGRAWIEPALLAPHLVAGGFPPEEVQALMWAVPSWAYTPKDLRAGLTALWTLYHLHEAHFADEPDETSIRLADAGRQMLEYLVAEL
ncbi:hypothetical protein [Nonomuraea sp. NPDC050202]|uniref:hypothetical protein n=1 Tax=Nonomuraea sp. NPDC050202 TaxID=3155035 RepID=UPI0033C78289